MGLLDCQGGAVAGVADVIINLRALEAGQGKFDRDKKASSSGQRYEAYKRENA